MTATSSPPAGEPPSGGFPRLIGWTVDFDLAPDCPGALTSGWLYLELEAGVIVSVRWCSAADLGKI